MILSLLITLLVTVRFNGYTMSLSFKGHTVVVTGAGGGLGKAYVSYLDTLTFSREHVLLLS